MIHRLLCLITLMLLPVLVAACGVPGAEQEFTIIGGESKEDAESGGFAFAGEDVSKGGPTIRVEAGDRVTITLENTHGQYFGERFPHGLAIVKDKDDRLSWQKPLWDAATSLIAVGESDSISFTPDSPGTYYYVCRVPGHVERGMCGEFVVEN